ncbi:hypothetical protein [uncultured Clostridium sp.]|uniref:hypothetical protein n=1 Tax=uncultured Clostridium sp. TaxID=59620 RepID=UPI0028E8570C|nr:hypothetical protein [uncultured Clostridium sp.]
MINKIVEKDERTTFIENASYKFGYNFIAFALLLNVVYRGIRFNEAPFDLLMIVIISGFIMTVYQYKQKILGKTWINTLALTSIVTFIFAFLLAFIMKKF